MDECKVTPPARHCCQLEERAPDFCLPAFHRGRETEVCLQDFRGKWLLLFFYASDFTFV